jgi:hypothetical protein
MIPLMGRGAFRRPLKRDWKDTWRYRKCECRNE